MFNCNAAALCRSLGPATPQFLIKNCCRPWRISRASFQILARCLLVSLLIIQVHVIFSANHIFSLPMQVGNICTLDSALITIVDRRVVNENNDIWCINVLHDYIVCEIFLLQPVCIGTIYFVGLHLLTQQLIFIITIHLLVLSFEFVIIQEFFICVMLLYRFLD